MSRHAPSSLIRAFRACLAHPALLALLLHLFPAPAAAGARSGAKLPPGVFLGSLEGEESPMVFLAFNKRMTAAYDERGGSLFLAWDGPAAPSANPTAGPAQGPMPPGTSAAPVRRYAASGPVYHRRLNPSPWSVRGPKGNIPVTVAFAGVSAHGELAALSWTLRLPDGRKIAVREVPTFDNHYGDNGLFRTFTVTGIPAGMAVRLDLGGRGMEATWGGGGTGGVAEERGRPFFVQEADGESPLKVTWSAAPALGVPALGEDLK